MKKKLFWILGILAALVLLATLIGPGILLDAVRQPEPAESYTYSDSFYSSYEEIRAHLQELSADLGVEISSHAINADDGLYIDAFYLPSTGEKTNLLVLTTGVHGIEGYIGSVMLDVFFQEVYPTLDTADTGVLVVANVNPYGMKYFRRYNEKKRGSEPELYSGLGQLRPVFQQGIPQGGHLPGAHGKNRQRFLA